MKNNGILKVEEKKLFYTGNRIIEIPDEIVIYRGITVLCGDNGSGKSTFAQILEKGRNFRTNRIIPLCDDYLNIKCIEFNDIHSLPGVTVEYYQQRYEEAMNEYTPTVKDIFKEKIFSLDFQNLSKDFKLGNVAEKKINSLSSGELRKLLIINALLNSPELLILDNPYIGLDKNSRGIMNVFLKKLKDDYKSVMLILQDIKDAPEFTDHFIYACNQTISIQKPDIKNKPYIKFQFKSENTSLNKEKICQLRNCNIRFGKTTILENFNWEILSGDKWLLKGPNGSGKSTLLSLLNADNPKCYCNDIELFGKKRGSGESIWDIKKNIGYTSPEMQLHFHGSGTVLDLVANGLNDTVGNYVKPSIEQKQIGEKWLKHFGISHLRDKYFNNLSSGEKQIVLIARSFVKEPQLLILDEPMHALDPQNREILKKTIMDYVETRVDTSFIMVTHDPEDFPLDNRKELNLSKID